LKREDLDQGREELRRRAPELVPVAPGEPAEDPLPPGGEDDQDLAMVVGVPDPPEQPLALHPDRELDHAVMPELELPGEGSHRRDRAHREPLHREEELVLLGLEARLPDGPLAEDEEPPDEVSEARQRLVVVPAKLKKM
jgi:hypothetical protein